MRIGTWNLKLCPSLDSPRGKAVASWLDEQEADVWLLTEVHQHWDPRGGQFVVSPPRGCGSVDGRWAGIQTIRPLGRLRTAGNPTDGREEALCLARLEVSAQIPTVLVACSVLPWRGAGKYWPGLPPRGQLAEFTHVLDHHVSRIAAERLPGEPLIWGGDFNQQLIPPFRAATTDGAVALRGAFDVLGLVTLTASAEHLDGASSAIDHIAVSEDLRLREQVVSVHRPTWTGGQLSDHAAYTVEVELPTTPLATDSPA